MNYIEAHERINELEAEVEKLRRRPPDRTLWAGSVSNPNEGKMMKFSKWLSTEIYQWIYTKQCEEKFSLCWTCELHNKCKRYRLHRKKQNAPMSLQGSESIKDER